MERKQWTKEGVLNFVLDMADAAETDSTEGLIEWAQNQNKDIKTIIKDESIAQINSIARAKFEIARREGSVAASLVIIDQSEAGETGLTLSQADKIIQEKGDQYMEAARLRTADTEADRIALAQDILELESLNDENNG